MKYLIIPKDTISICNHSNSYIFMCEEMLSSCVKISCFCTKAQLVFYWCFYDNMK